MSYGTDVASRFRQAGVMSGQILKGTKRVPVLQSTKFEFVRRSISTCRRCYSRAPTR
jgi:hypothetical protein